jgi:hypothetical protein
VIWVVLIYVVAEAGFRVDSFAQLKSKPQSMRTQVSDLTQMRKITGVQPGSDPDTLIKQFLGVGDYLMVEGLRPHDKIVMEFPLKEETDYYTLDGVKYTVVFKGSTVIDISPRDVGSYYQVYDRAAYKANKAPMRQTKRFATDQLIALGAF